MKKSFILVFLWLLCLGAAAQSISVKSFQPLPMDLTASSLEGKRIDQNGDVAALIKVVTTETGFVFEGGTLGIVDTKQTPGEVWVWVPRAARKITIKHPKLGVLRDYYYPVEIEAERTYEMVLTTAKIETIVKEEVTQQYLIFELEPKNATLEVNDQLWSVDSDGIAAKYVGFGTYSYRVRAADHFTDAGMVTVNDPDAPKTVKVTLKPNFTEVTLVVDANAEIWVNNEKKGVRSWTGSLGNGTYRIECKQVGCETTVVSKEITAEINGQTITLPVPIPVYGSLNVESNPNLATLYIDGEEMGRTPRSINEILVGEHELRLTKDGYLEYSETVTITKGERKQVKVVMNALENEKSSTSVTYKEEETFTVNGVSFTMKFVEGGTFQMGSNDREAESDEKPVHSVTLNSYYMGETEVTQALWQAVMGNNPSYFKGNSLPVEQVSWNDCQKFIRELNQLTGREFRLPTEAEWEYAAQGGNKSKGFKYAGSDNEESVAWYYDNSNKQTHQVKGKLPNELGIFDMCGNIWEWCNDWYGKYDGGSQINPIGSPSGSRRVLRGGGWHFDDNSCRALNRSYDFPNEKNYGIGFRLCLPK